jgi:hypothetical protein
MLMSVRRRPSIGTFRGIEQQRSIAFQKFALSVTRLSIRQAPMVATRGWMRVQLIQQCASTDPTASLAKKRRSFDELNGAEIKLQKI